MASPLEITGPLQRIEDHCADGRASLVSQFRGKPRIEAFLCAFLESVQELDDASWQVLTERGLDSAVGAQLDIIGAIVGEERQGREDEEYRPFLRARVLVNRSHGRTEEMLAIARIVLGNVSITLREEFPAAFTIVVDVALELTPATLFRLLHQAKAAGVRLFLEYTLVPDDETFTFASAAEPELDPSRGFGSAFDANTGGRLAGVIG